MTTKLLEVPYYSQLDKGAEYYTNDCLAACLRMVWGYTQIKNGGEDSDIITVNDFSKYIYKRSGDLGGILDIYKLPASKTIAYKPVSKSVSGITPKRIRKSIDLEWPVIALVLYSHIRQIKPIGHFIVISGYDDTCFVYQDPYYVCFGGKDKYVPELNLTNALAPKTNEYFSNPYQGLIHHSI